MAAIKVTGSKELQAKLDSLCDSTPAIAKKILYDGTAVMADAIKAAIYTIPVQNGRARAGGKVNALNRAQRDALAESLGVTRIKCSADFVWNDLIGFDGYNGIKTKLYPNGQPNQMIARSVEAGSSVRAAFPFVTPARRRAKKAALAAEQQRLDEEAAKMMNEGSASK